MQQQQSIGQNQQPVMMAPPEVITPKDLYYLTDQMSWLLDAFKKCAHYANECTDPNIGQVIDRAGQMHLRHYNVLLAHCKNNNTQAMAAIPQQSQ